MPWNRLIYEPRNGAAGAGDEESCIQRRAPGLACHFISDLEDDVEDIMTKSTGDIILGWVRHRSAMKAGI